MFPIQEVIALTIELVAGSATEGGVVGSGRAPTADDPGHSWKVGDAVQAVYSSDGQ